MKAVVLTEYGGPEVLRFADIADPQPGPEEVLVQVHSTALNRADLLQRMGLYRGPASRYEIPGLEYAGEVVSCGELVTSRSVGDRVMGILGGGCYAEFVVAHERTTSLIPDSITMSDAAAIPEAFLTAFDALVLQGGLERNDWALVHAGASGVGTAAIQVCGVVGARVAVTASAPKLAACNELGAAVCIDYTSQDFAAVLQAEVPEGLAVVLDVVGGDALSKNLTVLAEGGRILQVGFMAGMTTQISLGQLLTKRAHLIGTTLRLRPIEEKISLARSFNKTLLPLFETGQLRPVIDSRFPFSELGDAHEYLASNQSVGKVVIEILPA